MKLRYISPMRAAPAICLVLLDLMMPVMNGWEFYRVLRADEALRATPVAVVSAYATAEIDVPETDILEKPFDMDKLQALAQRYCNRKAAP